MSLTCMYSTTSPFSSSMSTVWIAFGEPWKIFFWKKHGLCLPSGQRTSVSGDLVERSAGDHALGTLRDDVDVLVRRLVTALEEQPVLGAVGRLRPDEMPATMQLLALQRERQPALLHRLARVAFRLPRAAI